MKRFSLILLSTLALSFGAQAQEATDLQSFDGTYRIKGEDLTALDYKGTNTYRNGYLYLYSTNNQSHTEDNANNQTKQFPWADQYGDLLSSNNTYSKTFLLKQGDALAIRTSSTVQYAKLAVVVEGGESDKVTILTTTGANINTGTTQVAQQSAGSTGRSFAVHNIGGGEKYIWIKAESDIKIAGFAIWSSWDPEMITNSASDPKTYNKTANETLSISDVLTTTHPRIKFKYNYLYQNTNNENVVEYNNNPGFVWDFTGSGNNASAVFIIPSASETYLAYVDDSHKSIRIKSEIPENTSVTLQLSYPEKYITRYNLGDGANTYSVYWPGGTMDLTVKAPEPVDYTALNAFDITMEKKGEDYDVLKASGLYENNFIAFVSKTTSSHLVATPGQASTYFDAGEGRQDPNYSTYFTYENVLRLAAGEALGFKLDGSKTGPGAKLVLTYRGATTDKVIVKQTNTTDIDGEVYGTTQTRNGAGNNPSDRSREIFDITPGKTVWITTSTGVDIVGFVVAFSWEGTANQTVTVEENQTISLATLLQDNPFNISYKYHRLGGADPATGTLAACLPTEGISVTTVSGGHVTYTDGNLVVSGLTGTEKLTLTVPSFWAGTTLIPPLTATLTLSGVAPNYTPFTGSGYTAYDYNLRRDAHTITSIEANSYLTVTGNYNVAYNLGPSQTSAQPYIKVVWGDETTLDNCETYVFTNQDGSTTNAFAIKAKDKIHGKTQKSIVRLHYAGEIGNSAKICIGDNFLNPETTFVQGCSGVKLASNKYEDNVLEIDVEGGKTIWFCADRGTIYIAAYEVFVYHRAHFGTVVDHDGDTSISTSTSYGHAWTNYNPGPDCDGYVDTLEPWTGYQDNQTNPTNPLEIVITPDLEHEDCNVMEMLVTQNRIPAQEGFIALVRSDYQMGKTEPSPAIGASDWDHVYDDRHYYPDYSQFTFEVKHGDEDYISVDPKTGQVRLIEDFDGYKTLYIVLPEGIFTDNPNLDAVTSDPDKGKKYYHPTMKRAVKVKVSTTNKWADIFMYQQGQAIANGSRVTYIHKTDPNKDIEIPTFKAFLRKELLLGKQAQAFGYWENQPANIPASKFANAEVGDIIFITISDCRTQIYQTTAINPVTGESETVTHDGGKPTYQLVSPQNENIVFTNGFVSIDDGTTVVEFTIQDDETLEALQLYGLKFKGAFFKLDCMTLNASEQLPDTADFTVNGTTENLPCWDFTVTPLSGTPWAPKLSYQASTWANHGTASMPTEVTYHEHREFYVDVTYVNNEYINTSLNYTLVLPKDPRGSYMWSVGADAKLIEGSDILTQDQINAGISVTGEYYISSAWYARMAVLFSEGVEINGVQSNSDKGRYYITYKVSDTPDFTNYTSVTTANDKSYKIGGNTPTLANPWSNTNTSITGHYREEFGIRPEKVGNRYQAMTRYVEIEVEPIKTATTKLQEDDNDVPAPAAGRPKDKWVGRFTFHFIAPPYMWVEYHTTTDGSAGDTYLTYKNQRLFFDGQDIAVPQDWNPSGKDNKYALRGKVFIRSSSNNQDGVYFSKTGQEPLDTNETGVIKYSTVSNNSDKHYATLTSGLFFATEFIETPKPFYTGEVDKNGQRLTATRMSVMSNLLNVVIYDPKVFYVGEPNNSDRSTVTGSNWAQDRTTTFQYTPFTDKNNWSDTGVYSGSNYAKDATITQTSMHIKFGTDGVYHFRDLGKDNSTNTNHNNGFLMGGLIWKRGSDEQDSGFDEYIDAYQNQWNAYDNSAYRSNSDDFDGTPYSKAGTANPYTEVNGMIGGPYTEDGGRFLQPVSGDFIRVEPEYDGVVSIWIRQNGAAQDAYRKDGNIARRPVYFVDEDGVVMKRTEYKPNGDHYFCVNGAYGVVSQRAKFRSDFSESWYTGITHWNKVDNEDNSTHEVGDKERDTYRLYGMWYPQFNFTETGGKTEGWHLDFGATSQIGRYQKMGEPVYRSEWLYNVEPDYGINNERFAKYGWEVPNFNYIRYRFPVKAGKTYYVGGRGTKNGFVAVKFEPLKANYEPDKFARAGENFLLRESDRYYEGNVAQRDDYVELTTSSYDQMPDASNPNLVYHKKVIYDSYATATLAKWSGFVDDTNDYYNIAGTDGSGLTYNLDETDATKLSWMTELDKQIESSKNKHSKYPTISVRVTREFKAGKWHPIVLPFSVSESRLKAVFGEDVAVIYLDPYLNSFQDRQSKFQSVAEPAIDGSNLRFTRHYYQMLYAGMPAFIRPAGKVWKKKRIGSTENYEYKYEDVTTVTNPVFKRVTYQGSQIDEYTIDKEGQYKVTGSYSPTTVNDNNEMYYVDNVKDTNEGWKMVIMHASSGCAMKGGRVWIARTNPGAVGVPRLTTVGMQDFVGDADDEYETSSIIDLVVENNSIERYANDDNVYDMQGRIVGRGNLNGLAKGVYIFHGRKEVVR